MLVSGPPVVPCWCSGPVLVQWSSSGPVLVKWSRVGAVVPCWCSGPVLVQWSSSGPVLVQWSSVSSPLVVPCWSHGPVLCWSAVQLLVARLVDVVDRDVADKADMLNMLKMSSYLLCQLVLQWSSSGPMVPCCVGQLSSCSWHASWTWWTETSLTRPTCLTCSR